jgi:CDP-glucose 4,6-dehydratase
MEFWKERRILLTGHTGFKGSWLSLWLQSLGANLVGFSLAPPTFPNLFETARVDQNMVSLMGDIRDFALLEKTIKHYQPEIIIHMAAQSLVRYSYQEPLKTYGSNVMGTVNLLEAVRLSDTVKAVINVTSDKCYENKEMAKGYCEADRLGGYDPYSNSKACAELVTQAYQDSYFRSKGIGIATVRAGNVIGGGDWASDRLVPDVIKACLHQKAIYLRYPNALRPWQHVLDVLSGYLLLAQRLYELPDLYSGSWNFGPNDENIKSVSWVADEIIRYWGSFIPWVLDEKSHYPETSCLKLDSTKVKTCLGWQPRWNIGKLLSETVAWYQSYQVSKDLRDKTLSQINAFMCDENINTSSTMVALQ